MTQVLNEFNPSVKNSPDKPQETRYNHLRQLLKIGTVGALGAAAIIGIGVHTYNEMRNPGHFSKELDTVPVQTNGSIHSILPEIENIDQVDLAEAADYVLKLPENVPVLEGGLHPGEELYIPVSYDK